jgi:hypothetical protein
VQRYAFRREQDDSEREEPDLLHTRELRREKSAPRRTLGA